jgi:hypothetical protein
VWRYLKSAFLVRMEVPALGHLPVNILLAAAFLILGIAQPAFWLLGLAVEVALVFSLAFNPRFQNYVQAQQLKASHNGDDQKRGDLLQMLPAVSRQRIADLAAKCVRVLDIYRSQQAEDYIIDSNRDALNRLQWTYLKLLVARYHLTAANDSDSGQTLQAKIAELEKDVQQPNQPDSLRESKLATLTIFKKRLENLRRSGQTLEEVDSDLTRIEAQLDLLVENASMQGKPQTIASDIELASDLLGLGVFGEDEPAVAHLDRKYSPPNAQQVHDGQ